MPEPTIKVRLVLLEPAMGGAEDDGLSRQERKALDIEEFKAAKTMNSKRFMQTAIGKVTKLVAKIVGWYIAVKKFLSKIPGKVLKWLPKLGAWVQRGLSQIKIGLGTAFQFIGTINPVLILEWMEDLGISTEAITGLKDGSKTQTDVIATLKEGFLDFMNIFSLNAAQDSNTLDAFGQGTTSFASVLDARPAVEAMGNLEGAVGDIDNKISELKQIQADIKDRESALAEREKMTPSFPSSKVTKVTKKVAKVITKINNPLSKSPVYNF